MSSPLPAATLVSLTGEPLSIALREPFVIASGRIDVTRAVLVRAVVADADGRTAIGLGEAAALPPVTSEDQPELLADVSRDGPSLAGLHLQTFEQLRSEVQRTFGASPIVRAAAESAIADGWARLAGLPLYALWRQEPTKHRHGRPTDSAATASLLVTDITLPISAPDHMSSLALLHRREGFTSFKVKVGKDWRHDHACLRAVAAAVPDARFRIDANAGFQLCDARALLAAALDDGLVLECFEQPCATANLEAMAALTAESAVPIVADESFRGAEDLERIIAARAAHAVNLKLVKLGGPLTALALAKRAREAGLRLMAGAMVETRVGLLAMAHVVTALGGVDWVDLDTAFLLADDPFTGGWTARGPHLQLTGEPGLGVILR